MPVRRRRTWRLSDLVGRIALAAGLAALGCYATMISLGFALRSSDPELAAALAPGDARVTVIRAETMMRPDASAAARAKAAILAQRALRRDPTAASAASTLGLDAIIRRKTDHAAGWFRYAERLTRRDLRSQVWLIEDAVGRGDVPSALRHYDIALRTSPAAYDLMLPVLAGAISDPDLRRELVDLLARRPGWGEALLRQIALAGPDYPAGAALFARLRAKRVPLPAESENTLMQSLVTHDDVALAWQYFAAINPGQRSDRVRNPGFSPDRSVGGPFDWVLANDNGVAASLDRDGANGVLSFSVDSGSNGVLVSQFQVLPVGRYRLSVAVRDLTAPGQTRPYWELVCADGRSLARLSFDNSAGSRKVGVELQVPAGCAVQTLRLIAPSNDEAGEIGGRFDRIELTPLD